MRQDERNPREGVGAAAIAPLAGGAAASGRHRRPFPRRERRGLINVMLTVAIAAVAVVVMVNMGITIRDSLRTSTLNSSIIQLEAHIRQAFANFGNYQAGSGNDPYGPLFASRMPNNARDGNTIVTPWGDRIRSGPGETGNSASNNHFWILAEGLTEDTCQTIAESWQGNSGVLAVRKGTTDINTAALIIAQCDGGGVNLRIVFRG